MTTLIAIILFSFPTSLSVDDLPPGLAAVGRGIEIRESDLYLYIASAHENTETGRSLLQQMVHETAIRQEMERRKINIPKSTLENRFHELDEAVKAESGGESGLADTIREQGVDEKDFYMALELSIAHEIMARSDFGLGADEAVPVEKLNLWLKELLSKKKILTLNPEKGAIGRVDDETITRDAFAGRLVSLLGEKEVSGFLTEMIGIALILARAGELGLSLSEAEIDEELREREEKLRAKTGIDSLTYADFLKASGQSLDEVRKSDKFRAEILLKKIARMSQSESDLKSFFEKNREFFELRFGKAARVATIFLKAARFPNIHVNRSFEDAEQELIAIKKRVEKGEIEFATMARICSEHESARNGGEIGFLSPGVKGELAEIATAALGAATESLLGPFRTPKGCHLVKVLGKRGPAEYGSLEEEVARRARQELYSSMLRDAKIERKY